MKKVHYNIQKNWKKLKPIYESQECRALWYEGCVTYVQSKFEDHGIEFDPERYTYNFITTPSVIESSDWQYGFGKRGRKPAFWQYALAHACHWMAEKDLYIAKKIAPEFDWVIISSEEHTTVFNGIDTIFDTTYNAMGISAEVAYKSATLKQ